MRLFNKQPFSIQRLAAIAASLILCAGFIAAQTPTPPPAPESTPKPPEMPSKTRPAPRVKPHAVWSQKKQVRNESEIPAERSIATDAKVNVLLCVSEGRVRINGWEHDEVRVFVNEGSELGFKIVQRNRQSEKPAWIQVLGFDPKKIEGNVRPDECLFGEDIELDVPRNATIKIRSTESATIINSVGKAIVENVGGDIFLSDILYGIDARTNRGSVTVEKSAGAIFLSSTVGNILVFDVSPSEIGDTFKAKTSNGAIVLQKVDHRQMEVGSNSGSIKFDGDILGNGQYSFGTQNGSILLAIPQNSSCKVTALYGYGSFNTELPMQDIVKPPPGSKIQSLSGVLGNGDATVKLTTTTGRIDIRKQ
jgi:Putative adhesin